VGEYSATTGAGALRLFAGVTAVWFVVGGLGAILLGAFGGFLVGGVASSPGPLAGGGHFGALPVVLALGGAMLLGVGVIGLLHFVAGLLHLVSRRSSSVFPAVMALVDAAVGVYLAVSSFAQPGQAGSGAFFSFWALLYVATAVLFLTPAVRNRVPPILYPPRPV